MSIRKVPSADSSTDSLSSSDISWLGSVMNENDGRQCDVEAQGPGLTNDDVLLRLGLIPFIAGQDPSFNEVRALENEVILAKVVSGLRASLDSLDARMIAAEQTVAQIDANVNKRFETLVGILNGTIDKVTSISSASSGLQALSDAHEATRASLLELAAGMSKSNYVARIGLKEVNARLRLLNRRLRTTQSTPVSSATPTGSGPTSPALEKTAPSHIVIDGSNKAVAYGPIGRDVASLTEFIHAIVVSMGLPGYIVESVRRIETEEDFLEIVFSNDMQAQRFLWMVNYGMGCGQFGGCVAFHSFLWNTKQDVVSCARNGVL